MKILYLVIPPESYETEMKTPEEILKEYTEFNYIFKQNVTLNEVNDFKNSMPENIQSLFYANILTVIMKIVN